MCLNINFAFHKIRFGHTLARRAKQDILVYKLLDYTYPYGYYTPYQIKSIKFKNGICKLHAFFRRSWFKWTIKDTITHGIHTCMDDVSIKKPIIYGINYIVHYAIIPKGAKYYLGDFRDIASNKLIIFQTVSDYYNYSSNAISVQELLKR